MQSPSEAVIEATRRKEVIDLLRTGKRVWTLHDLVAAGDLDTRSLLMESGTPQVYTPTIKAMGKALDRIATLARIAKTWGWVQSAEVREHHRTHDFDALAVLIGPLTLMGESTVCISEAAPPAPAKAKQRPTLSEIAEVVGVTAGTIRSALKRAGLPQPKRGHRLGYTGAQVMAIAGQRKKNARPAERAGWNKLATDLQQPCPFPDAST